MILFKFESEDTGFCRVYYRGVGMPLVAGGNVRGHLYCLQNEGNQGIKFYVCSRDGEPSHELRMPLDSSFDRKVIPA